MLAHHIASPDAQGHVPMLGMDRPGRSSGSTIVTIHDGEHRRAMTTTTHVKNRTLHAELELSPCMTFGVRFMIGDASGHPITRKFLAAMQDAWC